MVIKELNYENDIKIKNEIRLIKIYEFNKLKN